MSDRKTAREDVSMWQDAEQVLRLREDLERKISIERAALRELRDLEVEFRPLLREAENAYMQAEDERRDAHRKLLQFCGEA
jgi:hypothetical protein